MKTGMDTKTGKAISGFEYLRQRLADIINTPIGSLVGRREFGSRLHELVDRNIDGQFQMHCYTRLADAISNPANGLEDFKLTEMQLIRHSNAHLEIIVSGEFVPTGENIKMDGIVWKE